MKLTQEYKDDLIDLIKWYRDEYHRNEFGHNDLIERVEKAENFEEINQVEQVVDGWLDFNDE